MFTKLLAKSAAVSAAVGTTLALSLVSSPAMVTAAPEIRTVACDDYAAERQTTTTLELSRAAGQYGAINRATATVTDGDATPTGSVRFTVYDKTSGAVTPAGTDALDANGQATVRLSRYLRANRTYMVTANYRPSDSCEFQPSDAEAMFYTVYKRTTSTSVDAPARRAGQRPVVSVTVNAYFPERLAGRAKIVITKKGQGKALRGRIVRLNDRAATVSFKRLRPGVYTAKVRYTGNVNYAASSGADNFRVFRR
ncbi:MAG TPA: Ig-like domain-containing protein [Nocardioidaceae bacterium]